MSTLLSLSHREPKSLTLGGIGLENLGNVEGIAELRERIAESKSRKLDTSARKEPPPSRRLGQDSALLPPDDIKYVYPVPIEITFMDANQVRWKRDAYGVLHEVGESGRPTATPGQHRRHRDLA